MEQRLSASSPLAGEGARRGSVNLVAGEASRNSREEEMRAFQHLAIASSIVCCVAVSIGAASQELVGKLYRVVDGKVDAGTYNGFRRYHSVCSHCHGPDGLGSSFGPSLVEGLPDIETYRRIVLQGRKNGNSVMRAFADDPNTAPYVDDIYAYLQARADGALGRGRPVKLEP